MREGDESGSYHILLHPHAGVENGRVLFVQVLEFSEIEFSILVQPERLERGCRTQAGHVNHCRDPLGSVLATLHVPFNHIVVDSFDEVPQFVLV